MLIENFFKTMGEDFHSLYGRVRGENENNVKLAVTRMIVAIGMAFSTLYALTTLPSITTSPAASVLKIALSVLAYALCHDVFVITTILEEKSANEDHTPFPYDSANLMLRPLWIQAHQTFNL